MDKCPCLRYTEPFRESILTLSSKLVQMVGKVACATIYRNIMRSGKLKGMAKDGCGPLSREFPLRKRRRDVLRLHLNFLLAKCNRFTRRCLHGHPYGPGLMGPPPGYHPMQPHHIQPGQPHAYMGQQMSMSGHMPPQNLHPPLNGIPPSGFPPAIPAQLNAPNNSQSYSSPYAPKPPPSSEPQPDDQRAPVEEKPHSPPQQSIVKPEPIDQSLPSPQPQRPQQTEQVQQSQTQVQQQPSVQATQPIRPSQPDQTPHPPKTQKQSVPSPPERPQYNDTVRRAVETFKTAVLPQMKARTANAEEVIKSAVDRVLGLATESTVPGDPHEDRLMRTLSSLLSELAGSDFSATLDQPSHDPSPLPQSRANDSGTQAAATQPPVKPTGEKPTVMRPSFTGQGQNRPNGTSIPRLPMATPGMARTNSGGPANASSRPSALSASPAPAAAQGSPNGASTPKESPKEPAQLAGQKRPLDDADDMREFKKLSTSGPPQLKT
jgi:hypothetical protein